jgi:acyl phosphate:glycerol-3-phosphate acyltransferase
MPISKTLSLFLFAYIVGAIPFSVIVSRIKGIDLTKVGSGNYGATNVYRAMGISYAVLVFFLDALKGFIPVTIALNLTDHSGTLPLIVGLITIIGHVLSLFVKFKGGRGVAPSVGVLMALSPDVCVIAVVVGVAMILITRIVSLSNIITSIAVPVLLYFFSYPIEYVEFFGIISALIIIKHRANIIRLIKGNENRV